MNIWERLATYIVVATTKNCNQDEIFVAHTCGTSNRMICVDFDTIKMTRWLLASGRQSWLAKHIVGQEEKEDLPAYDAGCTKDVIEEPGGVLVLVIPQFLPHSRPRDRSISFSVALKYVGTSDSTGFKVIR